LLAEPAGSLRELEIAAPELDLESEVEQRGPIEGQVKLTRTNRGLFVEARLRTAIAQACSRCLRPIDWPVEVELAEEALPSVDLTSGLPLDSAEEPDVLRLTDHHELDLGGEIRDAIVLAEPIAPLCRDDCPGLCPTCGQELATGEHDHPDEDVDPRLEGLRLFKEHSDH
jgi:uncharacterized protein